MLIDDGRKPHRRPLGVNEATTQRICRFINPVLEISQYINTRSLGPPRPRGPTSSWRPFRPALGPSGLLDFVLWARRPCGPRPHPSQANTITRANTITCVFFGHGAAAGGGGGGGIAYSRSWIPGGLFSFSLEIRGCLLTNLTLQTPTHIC